MFIGNLPAAASGFARTRQVRLDRPFAAAHDACVVGDVEISSTRSENASRWRRGNADSADAIRA
jgi:hypothetical protein